MASCFPKTHFQKSTYTAYNALHQHFICGSASCPYLDQIRHSHRKFNRQDNEKQIGHCDRSLPLFYCSKPIAPRRSPLGTSRSFCTKTSRTQSGHSRRHVAEKLHNSESSARKRALSSQYVVPRLDARSASKQLIDSFGAVGPFILSNAFDAVAADDWCEQFVKVAHCEPVLIKESVNAGEVWMFETTLSEFVVEIIMESQHEHSMVLYDEDFLRRCSLIQAGLLENLRLPDHLFGDNWFSYFPQHLQPSPACLVITGEGCRSSFHRDAFEWTGTSICLKGSKLWTLMPPAPDGVEKVDEAFNAYRFPYEALGRDGSMTSIAAGWQANVDLYEFRDETCPNTLHLLNLSPSAKSDAFDVLETTLRNWWKAKDACALAPLRPQASVVKQVPQSVTPTCVIQRPGELLVIPAYWWHQTYSLEPSIGIASQFMNNSNYQAILRHIAAWTTSPLPNNFEVISSSTAHFHIEKLFETTFQIE